MFYWYLVFSLLAGACVCQRPAYAGSRPIGYPALEETTEAQNVNVGSKLGSGTTISTTTTTKGTTERLPLEALGDRKLVETLLKLPQGYQPFWLINWRKLEENRAQPKTYPLKQNSYLHPIPTSAPQPERFPYHQRPFQ